MDTDILLMTESGIRCRILHSVHCQANRNNKYMESYNEKIINHT